MGLKPTATRAFPAVAAFLLILTSQSLQAQQPSQDQIAAIRASCRSDFMANCSGVQPGGKDALECLKRNLARLSGSCQAAVSAIAPAAPAQPAAVAAPPPAAAPAAPVPAAVAAPPPHAATVVAAPRPVTEPQKTSTAQTSTIRQACRSDFMAHCPGVTPGGKEALMCLQRSVGTLSLACKTAVAATMHAPGIAARPVNAPASAVAPAAIPTAPPPAPAVAPLTLRPFLLPRRRLALVAICRADAERLCSGTPPGGERILNCLASQAASLSPSCYAALSRVSEQ